MSHVAVVLAAGKSTRMRSRLPKVAHPIAGRPMLAHVLFAAASALDSDDTVASPTDRPPADAEDHSTRLIVVLGHEAERVQAALQRVPGLPSFLVAVQPDQLGTANAVRAARSALLDHPRPVGDGVWASASTVLVLYGDTPLVRPETLVDLLASHRRSGATLTFLTGQADRPTDFGRVLRDPDGRVRGVIEVRHASDEQLRISEVNSGIYCFQADWLWARLDQLEPHSNGEYYLTDLVNLAAEEGQPLTAITAPFRETLGVNNRIQLMEAAAVLRHHILDDLMLAGVTVEDPPSTFVDAGVHIGQDTTLHPFTMALGETVIGEDCVIGPHSVIRDSRIGDSCTVLASWIEEAVMDPGSRIGPMSHLRPGAHLASGVHVGNFGEVKNASLGPDVQMHHFGYVGDAEIGARTNVGAGVVTVNYDGHAKHRTTVGPDAFIGSDTMLRAPITLGAGASTGAGSVVTHDVPAGSIVAGVPARPLRPASDRSSEPDPASLVSGVASASAEGAAPQEGAAAASARAHPPQSGPRPGTDVPSQPSTRQHAGDGPQGGGGKESGLDG